jgi:hypothetical protein
MVADDWMEMDDQLWNNSVENIEVIKSSHGDDGCPGARAELPRISDQNCSQQLACNGLVVDT